MKDYLVITYKNTADDVYEEKDLDCSKYTLRGHASVLIDKWSKASEKVYLIDHYNAISLEDVISIRVIKK